MEEEGIVDEQPGSMISRPGSNTSDASAKTTSRPGTVKSEGLRSRPASKTVSIRSEKETDGVSIRSFGSGSLADSESRTNDKDDLLTTEEPPKGCWHSFTHCVGGMWATREMSNVENDREMFVRTTIRELVVYCIFLFVLVILTFGMTSVTMFYYTNILKGLFADLKEVTTVTKFWDFMQGPLLAGLYWEYAYNAGAKNTVCPGGEEARALGPCPLAPSDRNILYENRLLGLPRMRQLRVRNDSCAVHEDFQNAIKVCYNEYSEEIEDKAPFLLGSREKTSAEAWKYQTSDVLKGAHYSGQIGVTYSGAGSVQDLSSLKDETATIIKELKEGLWIRRGTRFVSLDFTVYNANINLFCIVMIVFEFPATGGVIPSAKFRTVKLLKYVEAYDYFIMSCEFIFIAFIIYYIIEEALEIRKHGLRYIGSVWNVLDMVVVIISIICIGFSVYSEVVIKDILVDLLAKPDEFADFTYLGSQSKSNNNNIAICVFCAWVKLFKYISFNKTMTQLSSTLSRCAKDVAGFGVMFFIIFFAFAQLGYLLFGTQVKDFSSFDDAIFTLLRTILGDFNFHEIEAAHRVLGPIFFLSYVFFVFFVLLNMFLAIINDTYSEVKAEIAAKRNEFEIGDYFKRGYNNVMGKMGARNKSIDIENALRLANSDGIVTYEEIRQNLKKCNFSDLEIEMFFVRYDRDGNFEFDNTETGRILDDIDHDRLDKAPPTPDKGDITRPRSGKQAREQRSKSILSLSSGPGARGNVSFEEFNVITRRVERMERSVGSIVTKIDAVIVKLEGMEKNKAKKREAMTRILEGLDQGEGVDDERRLSMMQDVVRDELANLDASRPSTAAQD